MSHRYTLMDADKTPGETNEKKEEDILAADTVPDPIGDLRRWTQMKKMGTRMSRM